MRYILAFVFALACNCSWGQAQGGEPLYPELPDFAWEMVIDHVAGYDCQMIGSRKSQYLGQVDGNHRLCGFGYYIDQKDNQRVGLFRDGTFVYGITLTQTAAMIGTATDYACYSLGTAELEFVTRRGEKQAPPQTTAVGRRSNAAPVEGTQQVERRETDTRFVSITYDNGDRYIGEAVNGRRHGLGIYYYGNGDFWFGQYRNGIRDGYGCLYCSDHNLWIGHWQGEDARRVEAVRLAR